jgi:hypothetical protein
MSLGRDYDKACPIFNCTTRDAGVIFPFVLTEIDNATTPLPYIYFQGTDLSVHLARFRLPFKARVITCQAYACSNTESVKVAAATTEPIITIAYGPYATNLVSGVPTATIATITCDGAGPFGTVWTPGAGTTQVTLDEGQEIVAQLAQTAVSATTVNMDGGARIVVWLAQLNAPA